MPPRRGSLRLRPLLLGLSLCFASNLLPVGASAQLFRVNAGGAAIPSIDTGPDWAPDTTANPSTYLRIAGSNNTAGFPVTTLDPSVPAGTPIEVFSDERWDNSGGDEMSWSFPVTPGSYEVRLYFANGYSGTSTIGSRVFDVSIEGNLVLDNYDIVADVGHEKGVMKSFIVSSDASLDIDFGHGVENPLVNAIEILAVDPDGFLAASATGASFGLLAINTVASTTLHLTNLGQPGDADITITNVVVNGAFTTTLTPQTLVQGASLNFDVGFAPTLVGQVAGTLTITHDGNNSPLVLALSGEGFDPAAAPISFSATTLVGDSSNNPTSLDFGPDDRLYVAQQNGTIFAYTIQRNSPTHYVVIATEQIDDVKSIVNHDDDGSINPGQTNRQVTGLMAAGTTANPVLYVTSSDPRIGAGGGGNDLGLDTNSGVISRLTWTGSDWDHVQLVRGLPRSEENHATNGLDLDAITNTLYVMQGGHANKGAPANNFAQTPEYALSAAMLSVDLDAIEGLPVLIDGQGQQYIYDLPTLDDPSVPGPEPHDPFGGNDGRNQARIVPGGPVQVYSPGYRNAYDVVLTEAGRLYTFDNGPNTGWGGIPVGEGTATCTNESNENASTGYGDGLHHVTGAGYYGGHPNPTRGNPETSDLVIYENQGGNWVEVDRYDWQVDFAAAPPVPFGTGDPRQCDYQIPGVENQALVVINASTNGIAEYTASNFGGAMQGDLLAASFDGSIYRFELNAAGDAILNGGGNGEALLSGFGSQPLDVIAVGDSGPFPGAIFAAVYGAGNIAIFEPIDFGNCTGADDPALDEDSDGYDNADEIANGTNPCSAGSQPADADGDLTSDLLDSDDDNDGTPDTADPFNLDPNNGTTTPLPLNLPLFNAIPGTGYFGVGFTGLMSNGVSDPLDQFDPNTLVAGGAAGLFTVEQVSAGDAFQTNDSQKNAFLLGIDVDTASPPFVVNWRVNSPYFEVGGSPSTPVNYQSFGGFIGTGSQDDYLKVVVNAQSGAGGIEVLLEDGGATTSQSYTTAVVGDILNSIYADLFLTIDPAALTAQPAVSLDGGPIVSLGSPVAIPAAWFSAADAQGLAVGVISTSFGSGIPFGATWDFINASETCSVDADCDDAETCTVDSCVAGVCQNAAEPAGTTCESDGSLCTFDACDGAGSCLVDSNVSCPIGEACEPSTGLCEMAPGDADNDGLGLDDPCPGDPRNLCFGDVALDQTTLTPIRINTGGAGACAGAKLDCNGDIWNADFGFNTLDSAECDLNGGGEGCVISGIPAIFGCENDATEDIFQCERWDAPAAPELQYDFDLPNGSYLVNLYFANSYTLTATAGSRVFDIVIEGALVYDDFDQVAEAGGGANALVRSARVTVADGNGLQIGFVHGVENPAIKAIEILAPGPACTLDADCDDGAFCNGAEFCDVSGLCQPGTPPAADDGVACTDELCDEIGNVVVSTPNDAHCDDGLFCSGAETCNALLDCQPGTNPCAAGELCDEAMNLCELPCVDDLDCDGILDIDDPCASDPLNMCGAIGLALCTDATGNCSAPGDGIRYDAGTTGPTTTCDGQLWLAEAGAGLGNDYGGNVSVDSASVVAALNCTDGATEAALVSSERYGTALSRSYPVANGTYAVSLLFAEAFQANCVAGIGQRLMDVSIEGIEVLANFDVFATALAENGVGCGSLVVRSFVVDVHDGALDIALAADAASVDANAAFKAVKVVEIPTCVVDADCNDANACSVDRCNAGLCQYVNVVDGTSCDDGEICSLNDVCSAGSCSGSSDSDNDGLGDASDLSCSPDPCPADPLNACAGSVAMDGVSGKEIRVNAGPTCSVDFSDCRGKTWYADFGAQSNLSTAICDLPGGCPVNATGVFGCTDASTASLFRCEHYDPDPADPDLVYDFDVANGNYLVNLLFMNSYTGTANAGTRLFDVVVEGQLVLDEFDQVAAATGGSGPVVRSIAASVSDGNGLQIELLHGALENPAIKGIEVLAVPEPEQLLSLLAGVGLLAGLNRRRRDRSP